MKMDKTRTLTTDKTPVIHIVARYTCPQQRIKYKLTGIKVVYINNIIVKYHINMKNE